MTRTKLLLSTTAALTLLVFACGSSDTTAAPAAAPTANPYGAYYGAAPCDPSQPGCTSAAYPAQTAYPAQQAYPAQTAAPVSTMSVPGALALPCSNDSACIMGRCNTQYGKCAYPCQSAADCAQGASCNTLSGLCLPGG